MRKEIMVKVCSKCGIANAEKEEQCESCGNELDAPVTSRRAARLSKEITRKNEKLRKAINDEKHSIPLEEAANIPVTPAHKVIGVIGCLAAVCETVLTVLCCRLKPEFTYEAILFGICTLVLLAIAVLHCFMPGKMWSIDHCMDHLFYKERPTPSDTGITFQLIGCALILLMSIGFMVAQVLFL